MPRPNDPVFPRRKFLKGALGVAGASFVGFGPVAAMDQLAPPKALTLAYWNGHRFINSKLLASGDPTLSSVRVTVAGYNTKKATLHAPFKAWVAPSSDQRHHSRYLQTVDAKLGLAFKLHLANQNGSVESSANLLTGSQFGFKLQVGTYILMDGIVDLNQFSYDAKNQEAPLSRLLGSGPVPQYIILQIDRA